MNEWVQVKDELPPEDISVYTKIDRGKGSKNEQPLVRQGRMWFFPDRSMYVYYTPTHWMTLPDAAALEELNPNG